MSRSKYWCFTLNNYTDEEEANLRGLADVGGNGILYVCFGKETGSAEATPHLQGYLEFANKKRRGGVASVPGLVRAHLEARKGTQEDCIKYCAKDGDFSEFGTKQVCRQGTRSDLQDVKAMLDEGESEAAVAEAHFGSWCRYRRSFERYRMLKRVKVIRATKVFVVWGESGVGKTRVCVEAAGLDRVWLSSDPTLQWFDGYEGEDWVILDDYRGEASSSFILRILDMYPVKVPVKGSFRDFLASRIMITSNAPPPFGHECIADAFERRVSRVFHLQEDIYSDEQSENLEDVLALLRE